MCEWCYKHQGNWTLPGDAPDWTGKWAIYEVYCPLCGHRGCHVMPEFMEPWKCPDCEHSPTMFGEGLLAATRFD